MSPATIPADIEMLHQPCRDKIAALRSVARALEAENELLLKENENNRRHSQSIAGMVTNTTLWIYSKTTIEEKNLSAQFCLLNRGFS